MTTVFEMPDPIAAMHALRRFQFYANREYQDPMEQSGDGVGPKGDGKGDFEENPIPFRHS